MIRGAIEQQDRKTLQRAAHTLKGSTRYFGATQVSEMALQLESMGARGHLAPRARCARRRRTGDGQVDAHSGRLHAWTRDY